MAAIPANIWRDPKFVYLSDYFTPEEAARIVMAGTPLNRPGVVPSVQVPPGAQGCAGLGETRSLLEVAGDIPAPVIKYDPNAVFTSMPISMELTGGRTSPGSVYPTAGGGTSGDWSSWAEDNSGLLLALIGGVTAVALLAPRRGRR